MSDASAQTPVPPPTPPAAPVPAPAPPSPKAPSPMPGMLESLRRIVQEVDNAADLEQALNAA